MTAPRGPATAETREAPKLSVVITYFKGADVICDAVRSVLAQTVAPHEIVICDDGSPDDLAAVLGPLREHVEIVVDRHDIAATHGAGCTHSATLAVLLARGLPLVEAARGAARAASDAVLHGLPEIGAGDGPVDALDLKGRQ